MQARIKPAYLAALAAFVATAALSRLHATPYNNFVLLAQAFLHGHAWIDWPGNYIDALRYTDGRYYVIEAPLPAVLLLPVVAIFGGQTNQTLLSVILVSVGIGAAWELGERFGLPWQRNVWICAFLLAGTDLLWCAMLGDVWFIAHVCAVAFTLLALLEAFGKKRGWLVALWAVCALESRFTMALAIPVYAWLICEPGSTILPRLRRARILAFCGVLLVAGILWAGYNEARWGTLTDIGYTMWYHADSAGSPIGSPFQIRYLTYQLESFFISAPHFTRAFPYVVPDFGGIALTWTSPALLLAFAARRPKQLAIAMWIATALTAIPNLLYYVNGYAQFGMRHALDFEPFLFVLMALAAQRGVPAWGRVLIAYSVLVGLWGCAYWNHFVRPLY
ncbi:MAG: hypothetical protein JO263_01200 [Candidatus Eremiobacteraeota bacterium]|nr:hypothetical protein [Candidatus Eremiobacteraeota bacterium]